MNRILTLCTIVLLPLHVLAVQVTFNVQHATCQLANGQVTAVAFGGLPPYNFTWETGASTATINGLPAGTYTVTVTDGQGDSVEGSATVQALNTFVMFSSSLACGGTGHIWVTPHPQQVNGPFTWTITPDDGWPPVFDPGNGYQFSVNSPGEYTITGTSANGCTGTITEFIPFVEAYIIEPQFISPACGNEANGSFLLDLTLPGDTYGMYLDGPGGTQTVDCGQGPCLVNGLAAGTYIVQLFQAGDPWAFYCAGVAPIAIPSLTPPCGSVSGMVFHDADQNCTVNAGDVFLPGRVLSIGPDEQYAITGPEGQYQRSMALGSHTIAQSLQDMVQLCPATDPVEFTLTALDPAAVIDFAVSSTVPHDVSLTLIPKLARPGFPAGVFLRVKNHTIYPSGALEIALAFDALLEDPDPANGQWSHTGLGPYEEVLYDFNAMVPADIDLLGEVLTYTATVTNTTFEEDLTNNTATVDVTITGSYDPNDKQGWANASGSTTQYFLAQDTWIDYLVRFQNTGTDTAFTVVVRDEIDVQLDMLSLDILGASHTFIPSFGEGRELVFTFDDILLPDSTTDLAGSQGYVAFRLRPVAGLLPGDVIPNTAAIYFDFNEAIITNTTEHMVETSTTLDEGSGAPQRILLVPNPATDVLQVLLPENTDRNYSVLAVDGRIVQVPGMPADQGIQLDVRSLAPGTYLLRTSAGTARFIKQ